MATALCFPGAALIGRRQSCPVASWIDYCIALLSFTIAASVVYEHHLAFTVVVFMVAGLLVCQESPTSRMMLSMLGISYGLMANYFEITLALANTHFNFLQSYRLFGPLILLVILYRLRADWRGRTTPVHPWLARLIRDGARWQPNSRAMRWPTTSATSCEPWRCPRRRHRGP